MSSSRRSMPTKRPHAAGGCPTCGSQRVVSVKEDVMLKVGRRVHCFPDVAHERCTACGERIFGIEASQQFDAVILKRRRRAA
jgi:YgiT-type zinc finger domain-containing protein